MSIAGTWQNEYGSIMELQVNGNDVYGSYRSSTGSVGIYAVVGVQRGADPSPNRGQPIALAIEWHSIGDDPPDPSWNWSSGLSGQLSIQNGEEVLVLAHLLIASSEFPDLAAIGNYVDKLTYRRVLRDPNSTSSGRGTHGSSNPKADDPLAGAWVDEDGTTMALDVTPDALNRFGYVSGTIALPTGDARVRGFTDINATSDGLALQSLAITTADEPLSLVASLSGTLDLSTGVLNLFNMRSGATTPANSYVQTRMSTAHFTRQ